MFFSVDSDCYNHMLLLPIVRMLLILWKDVLDIDHHLPNLPSQDDASFTHNLLEFMKSDEWRAFLGEQVDS